MLPLERKLAGTDGDGLDRPDRAEPGPIEGIATCHGLGMDSGQVRVDGKARLGVSPETLQLRMAGVAASLPAEHRPGQQGLAPQRHEPLRVEIFGVQGPETHDVATGTQVKPDCSAYPATWQALSAMLLA